MTADFPVGMVQAKVVVSFQDWSMQAYKRFQLCFAGSCEGHCGAW